MAEALKRIFNACNPGKPATAEYYLDLAEARGNDALSKEFQNRLALTDDFDFLCFLFTGHIGCGKSSELVSLTHNLDQPTPDRKRYFPILLNAFDYLDMRDIDITDIFLAIVAEFAAALREQCQIELQDNYFAKRINEIRRFFTSDIEIAKGTLSLGLAKAEIQPLRRDPDAREKVRRALEPHMSTMLHEMNVIFEQARQKLKKLDVVSGERPYSDFVLIVDDLEKMNRFVNREAGLSSHRALFLDHAPQLTSLQAHIIYTVSLTHMRADGPQLGQYYDGEPFVLPMVKVVERGSRAPYEPGLSSLRHLLQRRLGNLSLEEVFEPDTLDFLLTYSGGHAKSLMSFVQNCCIHTDNLPIPLQAAHRAIRNSIRLYSTAIPEPHWNKLAQLDCSTDQKIPGGDDAYLAMLENLSILEYINGGGDLFGVGEPWYAVHPIVRELQKFKAAVGQVREGGDHDG